MTYCIPSFGAKITTRPKRNSFVFAQGGKPKIQTHSINN